MNPRGEPKFLKHHTKLSIIPAAKLIIIDYFGHGIFEEIGADSGTWLLTLAEAFGWEEIVDSDDEMDENT